MFWPSADVTHYSLATQDLCGGAPPLRPKPRRSRAKSTERKGVWGAESPPLPLPTWPSGQGALRTPNPFLLENRRGHAQASPGRGLPYPWACFKKMVGQAHGGQLQAVHGGRVRVGERWESAPWPGPPGGRVVHAPGPGGVGKGTFPRWARAPQASLLRDRP